MCNNVIQTILDMIVASFSKLLTTISNYRCVDAFMPTQLDLYWRILVEIN